ncbi:MULTISPECIES: GntR family transcriptional regulator [Oenococcus]|uniref:GntR family transcriptional regulator n=1 Tax=Oenococcus kitaharae DSM 17330 TaxID=1045004 RepID=G9WJ79_9LACO|nr:GntR family transcriptional regulator [Oenococcus kitaharae]EHN58685.1 GntR family transcriptional regulator [Oenococcus kitaharae DSM 17330]OEY83228.1 GntR family transcriptional regulator [Oenococcus kitaharae]OEY84249.1 GntR family transcriptional regulator [Oenococcus kitaharae]OEY85844.1 GntR family transcriptional regulator [Oenococcus kitaharae]
MAISSKKPIYLQLVDRIKNEVATDILSANDQLPSVREMALQERINPNTVAKAYKELERQEVIKTLTGKGTFVTGNTQNVKNLNQNQLFSELSSSVDQLLKNGVTRKQIEQFVDDLFGGKNAKN